MADTLNREYVKSQIDNLPEFELDRAYVTPLPRCRVYIKNNQ